MLRRQKKEKRKSSLLQWYFVDTLYRKYLRKKANMLQIKHDVPIIDFINQYGNSPYCSSSCGEQRHSEWAKKDISPASHHSFSLQKVITYMKVLNARVLFAVLFSCCLVVCSSAQVLKCRQFCSRVVCLFLFFHWFCNDPMIMLCDMTLINEKQSRRRYFTCFITSNVL